MKYRKTSIRYCMKCGKEIAFILIKDKRNGIQVEVNSLSDEERKLIGKIIPIYYNPNEHIKHEHRRPKTARNMYVRLFEEEFNKLKQIAERENIKLTQCIQYLINKEEIDMEQK